MNSVGGRPQPHAHKRGLENSFIRSFCYCSCNKITHTLRTPTGHCWLSAHIKNEFAGLDRPAFRNNWLCGNLSRLVIHTCRVWLSLQFISEEQTSLGKWQKLNSSLDWQMSPEWAKPEKYLTIRKSQVKLQGTRHRHTHTHTHTHSLFHKSACNVVKHPKILSL